MLKRITLAAAAIATIAMTFPANASATPFRVQQDGPWVTTQQDRQACAAQPELPWCAQVEPAGFAESTWSTQAIADLQTELTARFQYSYETDLPWRSHYDAAASGNLWLDDCDGLTFTVLDALARRGFPRDKMFRAVVRPEGNASFVAHMVGIVEVDGIYLVVGDTDFTAPYPLAKARFAPVLLSKVSEGPRWRRATLNARPLARPN